MVARRDLAVDASAGRQRRRPTALPARVTVDEAAVKLDGEWNWLYAAVDLDSLYLLECTIFSRHGTDPAAAFLHRLNEKYDLADKDFLVDAYGYWTALSRLAQSRCSRKVVGARCSRRPETATKSPSAANPVPVQTGSKDPPLAGVSIFIASTIRKA